MFGYQKYGKQPRNRFSPPKSQTALELYLSGADFKTSR